MQNITKIGLLFGVTFVLAIFLTKKPSKNKNAKTYKRDKNKKRKKTFMVSR